MGGNANMSVNSTILRIGPLFKQQFLGQHEIYQDVVLM